MLCVAMGCSANGTYRHTKRSSARGASFGRGASRGRIGFGPLRQGEICLLFLFVPVAGCLSLRHPLNTQLHPQWRTIAFRHRHFELDTRPGLVQHVLQLAGWRIAQRRVAANDYQQFDRIGHVVPLTSHVRSAPLRRTASPRLRLPCLRAATHPAPATVLAWHGSAARSRPGAVPPFPRRSTVSRPARAARCAGCAAARRARLRRDR